MSDRLRMTGLASGMDTQSIVEQLVEVQSYKKKDLKNDQTKLGWKQEAWKTLNSKIYNFYNNQIGEMRFESYLNKKKASIVDSAIATVSADNSAVNGVQTLAVKSLAKSAYVTGNKLQGKTSGSTVGSVMGENFTEQNIKLYKNADDKTGTEIKITSSMTLEDVADEFAKAGINASFDDNNNRFFLSAKESGKDAQFRFAVLDDEGKWSEDEADNNDLLKGLGITQSGGAKVIEGADAEIELNGATFVSKDNNFKINGLSITATKVSDYELVDKNGEDTPENRVYTTTNISTDTDVDGIYDTIKNFFKEYNDLINEMSKLYNAENAKDYKVLTDEEKEKMSDDEVEKWESKIKDSLLRRDDNLKTAMDTLRNGMTASFDINGKKYSLATFGISTLSYFESAENEKYALHIDGNKDDTATANHKDLLRTAITDDLESLQQFMKQMTGDIYSKMTTQMKSSEYRSVYSMYDDKALQKEYDQYTEDIKKEEERISNFEDKWYDKFAAMESAMEKMNSKTSALSSLLGMQ